jgi:hypothetical protein
MFLDLAGAWSLDLAASTHVGDQGTHRDAAAAADVGTFVGEGLLRLVSGTP